MNVAAMTQRQWYSRPEDEKFGSLEELHAFLQRRHQQSDQVNVKLSDLEFISVDTGDEMGTIDVRAKDNHYTPTHWSFGQLCSMLRAHPTYLRELPANIASQALNWGLGRRVLEKNSEVGLMTIDKVNGRPPTLQATTSQRYGRIWDDQLATVALELRAMTDGRFESPIDWGKEKRALFAGDRDCHILMVNGGSIVDAGVTAKGESDLLYRGFIMGNSEVGARAWYWATFLFRYVCGNFAIHGIEDVQFQRVIHTPMAPQTFAREALPVLTEYVNASPKPLEEIIKKAKDTMLPKDLTKHIAYFVGKGFTQHEVQRARMHALKEEGGVETLWQMVNGFTASARTMKYMDAKTALQTKAGKLLEALA